MNGSTVLLPPRSSDIATTVILSPRRDCIRSRDGISRRQGSHQVAQRLTRTSLPAKSERATVLPARSISEIVGAGTGGEFGMNSPSRGRSGVTAPFSAAVAPARTSANNKAATRLDVFISSAQRDDHW